MSLPDWSAERSSGAAHEPRAAKATDAPDRTGRRRVSPAAPAWDGRSCPGRDGTGVQVAAGRCPRVATALALWWRLALSPVATTGAIGWRRDGIRPTPCRKPRSVNT